MSNTNENYKSALYALLDLGIEIESDEMLEIIESSLNGYQLDSRYSKRVNEGREIFDSMFDKSINQDQLTLL